MIGRKRLMDKITESSALTENQFFGMPVIEIAGEKRVLIENHCGVREYGPEKISVNVKYGFINVCGEQLELAQMTKEQLVICGNISGVSLIRRQRR